MNQTQVKILGLNTKDNPLSAQYGSLAVASNVVIATNSEARPRRGLPKYGAQFTLTSGARMREIFEFDDKIHVRYGSTLAYDTDGAGTWADYSGTYDPLVTNVGCRTAVYDDTLYIATTLGVKRTDAAGITPAVAGLPRCLPIKAVLSMPVSTGMDGFFSTANQVAYRATFRREDSNNRVIESAPSGRAVVINSAGSRDCTVTVYIPSGIVAGDKLALFRSLQSGSASVEPSDDLYLCKEYLIVAGDITAGYVSVIDDVKQDALSDRLYTSDEGVSQSNFRPPVCSDICVFRDHTFYIRTRQPHRLIVRLQKVFLTAKSEGLTNGNTLVIGGVTYTADSTEGNESPSTAKFWVDIASADARTRIQNTAMSLCRVVNGNASNTTIYAFYEGSFATDPGLIVFESRTFVDTAFVMTAGQAAAGASFNPVVPTTGTTVTSTADERKNGTYFSKPYQPDAVPLGNELLIGDEAESIVRGVSTRSALWFFTESGKVYRLTGNGAESWAVTLFDSSTVIYGPKTAASVEGGVVLMTTRGAVLCTDAGIKEVGDPINDQLTDYVSIVTYPNFELTAFGLCYASDRCYILWQDQIAYVWCYETNAWTTWDVEADAGMVLSSNNRLYTTRDDGYVRQERKNMTRFDYSDQDYAATVVSRSGYDVVLSSVSGFTVGQGLYQSATCWGIITAIDTGTSTVTLDRVCSWQSGSATVHDGITCSILWNPLTGGNPAQLKRYGNALFFWRQADGDYTGRLTTNFDDVYTDSAITPVFVSAQWGSGTWGGGVWGGSQGGQQVNRMSFPIEKIRGLWCKVGVESSIPWSEFRLSGCSILWDNTGNKFNEKIS